MTPPTPKDDAVIEELRALRAQLADEHMDNKGVLHSVLDRLGTLERAFPAGDFEKHSRWHERRDKKEARREKLLDDLASHLAKASTVAALGGVAWVLLRGGKDWLLMILKGMP